MVFNIPRTVRDSLLKLWDFSPIRIRKNFKIKVLSIDPSFLVNIASKGTSLKSVPWTLAEFYFNRGLQRPYAGTYTILQKTINGFLCLLIVFLTSEIHQLNFEGRD